MMMTSKSSLKKESHKIIISKLEGHNIQILYHVYVLFIISTLVILLF